jgi:putative endonuclease
MYTVYVLRSRKDGFRYIGCTEDLSKRLKKHHSGQVTSTKGRRPFDLVYSESQPDWSAARKRENFLKSGQGRAWLDQQGL